MMNMSSISDSKGNESRATFGGWNTAERGREIKSPDVMPSVTMIETEESASVETTARDAKRHNLTPLEAPNRNFTSNKNTRETSKKQINADLNPKMFETNYD